MADIGLFGPEKKVAPGLAEEIAKGLAIEMASYQRTGAAEPNSIVEILLQRLAEKVVVLLKQNGSGTGPSDEHLEARLQKVDRKLKSLVVGDQDEDEDEVAGTKSSFPNLKYARPKYNNVESILKFVEQEADKGGVKLVIMNFND